MCIYIVRPQKVPLILMKFGISKVTVTVGNPNIFKRYLLRDLQWELATDH